MKKPVEVNLPDSRVLKATKIGKVHISVKTHETVNKIELKNVYFVQDLGENILSFSKITENCTIIARNSNAQIYCQQTRNLLAIAEKSKNLYYIKSCVDSGSSGESCQIYANNLEMTRKEKWHRALGHVNFQCLDRLVRNKMLDGLPENLKKIGMKCATCLKSKISYFVFIY